MAPKSCQSRGEGEICFENQEEKGNFFLQKSRKLRREREIFLKNLDNREENKT